MATVTKTRSYSTGSQITAGNYNDDRDEIIAGVNDIVNAQINAAAAIAATKIADTAVTLTASQTMTNKTLTSPVINGTLTGTAGFNAWTSFTPTFSNITTGNGSASGTYLSIGKTVHLRAILTFGTTTSVTGAIGFSFPVTPKSTSNFIVGSVFMHDVGVQIYYGSLLPNGSVYTWKTDSTYLYYVQANVNVPFTWGSGDELSVTATYEAA